MQSFNTRLPKMLHQLLQVNEIVHLNTHFHRLAISLTNYYMVLQLNVTYEIYTTIGNFTEAGKSD